MNRDTRVSDLRQAVALLDLLIAAQDEGLMIPFLDWMYKAVEAEVSRAEAERDGRTLYVIPGGRSAKRAGGAAVANLR